MTTILLNIGREVNTGTSVYNNRIGTIVEQVEAWLPHDVQIEKIVCVESHTEQTLLVQLDGGPEFDDDDVALNICFLAKSLRQDAIAVYHPATNYGLLIGPRTDLWGPFNPERFILEDGRTLAHHLNAQEA